ncbi:glycosyltransferase [Streptomyces parvulus]|nr:glycosyltransferase [Streptomyces parvulus]
MTVPTGPGAYGEASGYAADPAYGYTAPYVTAAHVDTLSYADPSQYTVTVVVAAYNASATSTGAALRAEPDPPRRRGPRRRRRLHRRHPGGRAPVRPPGLPGPRRPPPVQQRRCGRARNNGIESATGQYLLFLDADDELPHKACEVLLASALATGAEITAGRALRINLAKDETTVWQPQLYATDRTVSGGLAAAPELFDDPIAAAKLFRVDFLHHHGIRFPEGVFFEDTYFSTVAGFCARNITLLTAPVYRWMWERESDTPSITNRRAELRSIRDRVLVHQWADEFLARHGGQDLIAHKGAKFLSHDLRLYTPELRAGDEAYRDGFVRVTAPYLRSLPSDAYDLCGPMERVRAFALINGQVDLALSAADYTQRRSVLSSDLVERTARSTGPVRCWDARTPSASSTSPNSTSPAPRWATPGCSTRHPRADPRRQTARHRLHPQPVRPGGPQGQDRAHRRAAQAQPQDRPHLQGHGRGGGRGVHPLPHLRRPGRNPRPADRPATWNLFVQIRHAGQRATTTVCIRASASSRSATGPTGRRTRSTKP